MPNNKSAWKRMRQSEKRRLRNRPYRSSLRRTIKAFRSSDDAASAKEQLPIVMSVIDKAVKKGIIHDRKAARLKSRLARKVAGS